MKYKKKLHTVPRPPPRVIQSNPLKLSEMSDDAKAALRDEFGDISSAPFGSDVDLFDDPEEM